MIGPPTPTGPPTWTTDTNWAPNTLPNTGTGAIVNTSGTAYLHTGESGTAAFVIIDTDGGVHLEGDSILEISGSLVIGDTGTGALNIADDATVSVGEAISLGVGSGARGALDLHGGVLETTGISKGEGAAALLLNGGTIRALADNPYFFGETAGTTVALDAGDIILNAGGVTFDTQDFAITIANSLTVETSGAPSSSLAKLGEGTLTLTGTHYDLGETGTLTVASGTLHNSATTQFTLGLVTNDAVIEGGPTALYLRTGGTVNNSGTIRGLGFPDGAGVFVEAGQIALINNITSDALIEGTQYGVRSNADNADITITNSGTIRGADGPDGAGVYIERSHDTLIENNDSNAFIEGNQYGVRIDATNDATINNLGTIRSMGGPDNAGVFAERGDAAIINEMTGLIEGFQYGVRSSADNASIGNLGIIESDGIGVQIDGGAAVDNSGTIRGMNSAGIFASPPGQAVIITNNTGGLIESSAHAINLDSSDGHEVRLWNESVLSGDLRIAGHNSRLTLNGDHAGMQFYSAAVTGNTDFTGIFQKLGTGAWFLDSDMGMAATEVQSGTLFVDWAITQLNDAPLDIAADATTHITAEADAVIENALAGQGLLAFTNTGALGEINLNIGSGAGSAFGGTIAISGDSNIANLLLDDSAAAALTQATLRLDAGGQATLAGAPQEIHNLDINGGTLDLAGLTFPPSLMLWATGTLSATGGTIAVNPDAFSSGTLPARPPFPNQDNYNDFFGQSTAITADSALLVGAAEVSSDFATQITITGSRSTGITPAVITFSEGGINIVDATYDYAAIAGEFSGTSGLYMNYNLVELSVYDGQNLTLHTNAGDDKTLAARLTGDGGLIISNTGATTGYLILSNANNDYTGTTTLTAATLRLGLNSETILNADRAIHGLALAGGLFIVKADPAAPVRPYTLTVENLLVSSAGGASKIGVDTAILSGINPPMPPGDGLNGSIFDTDVLPPDYRLRERTIIDSTVSGPVDGIAFDLVDSDGDPLATGTSTLTYDQNGLSPVGKNTYGYNAITQDGDLVLSYGLISIEALHETEAVIIDPEGAADNTLSAKLTGAGDAGFIFSGTSLIFLGHTGNDYTGQTRLLASATLAAVIYGGSVTGPGHLIQRGSGATILTGDNNIAGGLLVQQGVLQIGSGAADGWATPAIATNATVAAGAELILNRRDFVTYSGVIGGAGAFSAIGTGTTNLTKVQTYAGPTRVEKGMLRLSATNALAASSRVTLATAALDLAGRNQTIKNLQAASSVIRYHTIGSNDTAYATLFITGSYTGDTTSYMNVDLANRRTDFLQVSGAATGTHQVNFIPTNTTPLDDPTRIYALEVIRTGDGDAATFTSDGIESGFHTYELHKGDGGLILPNANSWYLSGGDSRSRAADAVLFTAGLMGADWHYSLDTVHRRLGDIRAAIPADTGSLWARAGAYRLNASADLGGSAMQQDSFAISAGADKILRRANALLAAGAYLNMGHTSRTFDDPRNRYGDGATNTVGLGLYALWLYDNAWFVDLTARLDRSSNELNARAVDGFVSRGKYTGKTQGLSIEAGRRISKGIYWIEPGVQAAVAWINGSDYVISNGRNPDVPVSIGDADAWQYRGMMRAGADLGRWRPYARFAIVKSDTKGGEVTAEGRKYEPWFDGWRTEAGVGASYLIDERSQVYLDYDYATARYYERPWSFTLGYRRAW